MTAAPLAGRRARGSGSGRAPRSAPAFQLGFPFQPGPGLGQPELGPVVAAVVDELDGEARLLQEVPLESLDVRISLDHQEERSLTTFY